ncbi:alpha-L-fucosidase [Pedobacter sp. GSP4]|uniref:alpha-L-fucosidase n=1 Tax=Pedobacter sp. GSP4 TaxID=3453716 RepID=UPI003EEBD49F
MKKSMLTLIFCAIVLFVHAQKNIFPVASTQPNKAQKEQIARKYGMFMHFGINTFVDEEWTDGSIPAAKYNPPAVDAEQWIKGAKDAGMKYVILITKHHDGFSLWDSKYTTYDVASSGNKTNVVEAVAKACKKYNVGLGLYYSLWDRHENGAVKNEQLDKAYNTFLINQLHELLAIAKKEKVKIVEFWFDGGWVKANTRWPVQDIYNTIKKQQPDCQIGINWSIGAPGKPDAHNVHPYEQKDGYPIRYFPSDFRLGDPHLPVNPDPKIFSHDGKNYYMPWESTICLSGKWFYNTKDQDYKSADELYKTYKIATAQDNILIINCPPTTEGRLREKDLEILKQLKVHIDAGK